MSSRRDQADALRNVHEVWERTSSKDSLTEMTVHHFRHGSNSHWHGDLASVASLKPSDTVTVDRFRRIVWSAGGDWTSAHDMQQQGVAIAWLLEVGLRFQASFWASQFGIEWDGWDDLEAQVKHDADGRPSCYVDDDGRVEDCSDDR